MEQEEIQHSVSLANRNLWFTLMKVGSVQFRAFLPVF